MTQQEKTNTRFHVYLCVFSSELYFLCVNLNCMLFLSAWRVLVVLIKPVWEQRILIVYLGTALFHHHFWRTVLLYIKFSVDSCLFPAIGACHPIALWPLLFLMKTPSCSSEKPLHTISHFSRCLWDFPFPQFDYHVPRWVHPTWSSLSFSDM